MNHKHAAVGVVQDGSLWLQRRETEGQNEGKAEYHWTNSTKRFCGYKLNLLRKCADNSYVVVFLIFLASFAVLEVILWRADAAKKPRETESPDAMPSVVALARSLEAEGRGAAPAVAENKDSEIRH